MPNPLNNRLSQQLMGPQIPNNPRTGSGRDLYTYTYGRPISQFRSREGMGAKDYHSMISGLYRDNWMPYEVPAEFIRPKVSFDAFLKNNPPSTNIYTASPEEVRQAADRQAYGTWGANEALLGALEVQAMNRKKR